MNILIAITVLAAYTLVLIKVGGRVPSSLSASVFSIKADMRWIWSVMLVTVIFLCVPTYLERTCEQTQFLAFLAIGALAFVGVAPLVHDKEDMAYKVHCVSAVICAVCSQLVLVFNQPWLLLSWVPWLMAFVWITKDSKWRTQVFWAEMVCFASTFAYCLIYNRILCQ